MVRMAEVGAPISLDGVAVHPDCWCVCMCYLHFATENPEHGEMYHLVPAHPGCPGRSPESRKMVVRVLFCTHALCILSEQTETFHAFSRPSHRFSQQKTQCVVQKSPTISYLYCGFWQPSNCNEEPFTE